MSAQKVTLQLLFSKAKRDSIREHWWNPHMNSSVTYLVSYWRTDDPEARSVFGVFIGVVWRGDDSIWVCESISTIHCGVKEKNRERHINKSILAVGVSLLILYCILSSSQEKMCYHENLLLKYFISLLSVCISSCTEGTKNMAAK